MKKYILLIVSLLLITGCGSKLYQDTEKIVLESDYNDIKSNITNILDNLILFPTEKDENTIITYYIAINKHHDKFSDMELIDLYDTVHIYQYNYRLNSLGYTNDDVIKMIDEFKKEQS